MTYLIGLNERLEEFTSLEICLVVMSEIFSDKNKIKDPALFRIYLEAKFKAKKLLARNSEWRDALENGWHPFCEMFGVRYVPEKKEGC